MDICKSWGLEILDVGVTSPWASQIFVSWLVQHKTFWDIKVHHDGMTMNMDGLLALERVCHLTQLCMLYNRLVIGDVETPSIPVRGGVAQFGPLFMITYVHINRARSTSFIELLVVTSSVSVVEIAITKVAYTNVARLDIVLVGLQASTSHVYTCRHPPIATVEAVGPKYLSSIPCVVNWPSFRMASSHYWAPVLGKDS